MAGLAGLFPGEATPPWSPRPGQSLSLFLGQSTRGGCSIFPLNRLPAEIPGMEGTMHFLQIISVEMSINLRCADIYMA